jgi:hypothetical protein
MIHPHLFVEAGLILLLPLIQTASPNSPLAAWTRLPSAARLEAQSPITLSFQDVIGRLMMHCK